MAEETSLPATPANVFAGDLGQEEAEPLPPSPSNVFLSEEENSGQDEEADVGSEQEDVDGTIDDLRDEEKKEDQEVEEEIGDERDTEERTAERPEPNVEPRTAILLDLPELVDNIDGEPPFSQEALRELPGGAYSVRAAEDELGLARPQEHTGASSQVLRTKHAVVQTAVEVAVEHKEARDGCECCGAVASEPVIPASLLADLPRNSRAKEAEVYKKAKKECSDKGIPFVDHLLPSLGLSPEVGTKWIHVPEVWPTAVFMKAEGCQASDIAPGMLSGGPFLSAVSLLLSSRHGTAKGWLSSVFPSHGSQEALTKSAARVRDEGRPGVTIFRFSFWKWGQWVDVTVDDRLPAFVYDTSIVHNGGGDGSSSGGGGEATGVSLRREPVLACARSRTANEFWVSLLEKAYAKLHGGYQALHSMRFDDVLRDLTGGIVTGVDLRDVASRLPSFRAGDEEYDPEVLWTRLHATVSASDLLVLLTGRSCAAGCRPEDMGLLSGSAYAVRKVQEVTVKAMPGVESGTHRLVFLERRSAEWPVWAGSWSSRANEWAAVSKGKAKDLTKYAEKHPLGFWMRWLDVIRHFPRLCVCRKQKNSGGAATHRGQWLTDVEISAMEVKKGKNPPESTAGGCATHASWSANPQYHLQIKSPCSVVISLQQQDPHLAGYSPLSAGGAGYAKGLTIGYAVFGPLEVNRESKLHHVFRPQRQVVYRNTVEVAEVHRLEVGRYVVVPTTWAPQQAGKFLLHVQCVEGNGISSCKALETKIPKKTFGSQARAALLVRVHSASGLGKTPLHAVHGFCDVTVEGESRKTSVDRVNGKNPLWPESFLFFLRKGSPTKMTGVTADDVILSKPSKKNVLAIEVWDCGKVLDTFRGLATVPLYDLALAAVSSPAAPVWQTIMLPLGPRKTDKDDAKFPGTVLVDFVYFVDPAIA